MSKKKQELEQIYRDTKYSIFIENKQYDIHIGKSLPIVIKDLVNQAKFAVILTAWNPYSQQLSKSENNIKNYKLSSKLKKYTVLKAVGNGQNLTWSAEESFFILGMNKEEAEMLAVEYTQYAYVWFERKKHPSLIFTELWL